MLLIIESVNRFTPYPKDRIASARKVRMCCFPGTLDYLQIPSIHSSVEKDTRTRPKMSNILLILRPIKLADVAERFLRSVRQESRPGMIAMKSTKLTRALSDKT
jgi:hypothetical protein